MHGQFDVLARLAQPVVQGKTKVSGIKLEQKRVLRLLEILLQGASGHLKRWTTARLRQSVLDQCGLKEKDYTLNQIRYDVRKLRLHACLPAGRASSNASPIPMRIGSLKRDKNWRFSSSNCANASMGRLPLEPCAIVRTRSTSPIRPLNTLITRSTRPSTKPYNYSPLDFILQN